jgi:YgiT-type zinc finger domain-containing protein
MKCEFCSGKTKKRRSTLQHWLDGKLYVVEDAQVEVCEQCGKRYYHAKTLDAIDAMLRGKHQVKRKMTVEVVAAP